MPLLTLFFQLWLSLLVAADFGPQLSLWLPPDSTNNILEIETTLQLPTFLSPHNGTLMLWPGLETRSQPSDSVQTIAWGEPEQYCPGPQSQWCITCYTLKNDRDCPSSCSVEIDRSVTAVEGDTAVTIHYVYDAGSNNITPTATVGGNNISNLSTTSGKGQAFYTEVECVSCRPVWVPAHSYVSIEIVLESPDPNFATYAQYDSASSSEIVPSEEGKTWTIDWIHIDEYVFVV